jgi:hypothetical protein
MKKLSLKTKLGSLVILLGMSGAFAPVASAYTVYLLKQNYYAIVCADGQIFSYSGSAGGVGIVAPSLCEGHGGIAGGSGGGLTTVKATKAVSSAARSCRAGKKVDSATIQCPTRIRVNRIEMARSSQKPAGLRP